MIFYAQHINLSNQFATHKGENDRICMQRRKWMEIVPSNPRLECVHSSHQKISLWELVHTKFSKFSCRHHKWPKQRTFLKFNPKLFLILVMITLHQAWPSYIMSMPYICEGLCIIGSTCGNSKKTSPLKVVSKNWTFWKGILL